jgi:hypothetical protein
VNAALPRPSPPEEPVQERPIVAGDEDARRPWAQAVFRVVLIQAFWISLGYVAIGLGVEALRRITGREFWSQGTELVDSLALMLLRRAGLIDGLIAAAAHNTINAFGIRLLLSTTTVAAIFLQAFLLAAVFYAVVRFARRVRR